MKPDRTPTLPDEAQAVLSFWFEGDGEAGQVRKAWFRKDERFDREIALRFEPTLAAARTGQLDAWRATPLGCLALIVVLDQFSRNIHRGSPLAFEGDAQALALARELVSSGRDRLLDTLQRWFAYLPFEHSESLADQDESVRLFTTLAAEDERLADALDYAHRHREVIARYGRFPHRNAVLGRENTAQEAAYLASPGAGF
jgi:uncharacterized protein (DUF924 family)